MSPIGTVYRSDTTRPDSVWPGCPAKLQGHPDQRIISVTKYRCQLSSALFIFQRKSGYPIKSPNVFSRLSISADSLVSGRNASRLHGVTGRQGERSSDWPAYCTKVALQPLQNQGSSLPGKIYSKFQSGHC